MTLATLRRKSGQSEEASKYFRLAAQMPPDYVFPFRLETIKVLESAMRANPADARAPFYLGNLLYDRQPPTAIKLWEKSAAMDSSFALVYRNLAQGYQQAENDTPRPSSPWKRPFNWTGTMPVSCMKMTC